MGAIEPARQAGSTDTKLDHDGFAVGILNGWVNTLSRKRVKTQSLTFNSESASRIMPASDIWVLECMCECLFFQKKNFFRFDGKTYSKMDESENFLNVDNPYVQVRPRIRQFLSMS